MGVCTVSDISVNPEKVLNFEKKNIYIYVTALAVQITL